MQAQSAQRQRSTRLPAEAGTAYLSALYDAAEPAATKPNVIWTRESGAFARVGGRVAAPLLILTP